MVGRKRRRKDRLRCALSLRDRGVLGFEVLCRKVCATRMGHGDFRGVRVPPSDCLCLRPDKRFGNFIEGLTQNPCVGRTLGGFLGQAGEDKLVQLLGDFGVSGTRWGHGWLGFLRSSRAAFPNPEDFIPRGPKIRSSISFSQGFPDTVSSMVPATTNPAFEYPLADPGSKTGSRLIP